jgi:hypothetical protein
LRTTTEHRLGLSSALGILACGGSAPPTETPHPPPHRESRSEVERFFPAPDGFVYTYDTQAAHSGEVGVLMLQVARPRDGRVDLTSGGKVQRIIIGEDGLAYLGGGFLLRPPLRVGATFPGPLGPVEITAIDQVIRTPAGTYSGCLETVEVTQAPDLRRSTTTVLCPEVGVASIRVEATAQGEDFEETAVLRSFGPRVDLNAPSP